MITLNRILIVDDHAPFRGALREFLSREPDFQIVGEAGNIGDAIRSVEALSPDLVLTDLTMRDSRGDEAVTELKRCYPDVKIIVLSLHREIEYKHRCRKAGAAGYIVKDAIHDELCDGIRIVLGGQIYLGAHAAAEMVPDQLLCPAAASEGGSSSLH